MKNLLSTLYTVTNFQKAVAKFNTTDALLQQDCLNKILTGNIMTSP